MDIKNDLKNGVKLCADAATDVAQALVEKSRLKAKANRIKQVIKADTELRNQAYIELGRYFYETLREQADTECEALCVVVDKTTARIDKASRRYVELLSNSNDVKLKSENTEKIKKIVTDTAEDIKGKAIDTSKKAKDKATDLSGKAKIKAQDLTVRAKETVADLKDRAKDKAQDFKAFIAPDETDEELLELVEDYEIDEDFTAPVLEPACAIDEDLYEEIPEIAEPVVEVAEPVIEIAEPASEVAEPVIETVEPVIEIAEPAIEVAEFVDADEEMAELECEAVQPQVPTQNVITVDDEESPEEFEF